MEGSSMWRSKTTSGKILKPNSYVQAPPDVGSNPILDRQNPNLHGANTTLTYPIYSQEVNNDEWAKLRPLHKCYAPFLPELAHYVRDDDAIHLPGNG
jgi:hypothetical protein